ncbi:hypothetical protein [uncultured Psychrosphaera sp.]|jgi:hypothetical protein|uniref:hypothetical protein n=1 Tax=uncultured Psychrosphaera sp. TaxID=1403522 RepID=UPI002601882D|nr:hypothetical protein [uncultured Psychrosphaera sp.]
MLLNKKALTQGLISIVVITFLAGCILPRPMGGHDGSHKSKCKGECQSKSGKGHRFDN